MSTTLTFYIRTTGTAFSIEESFREHFRTRDADPARYWINVHPADAEAKEGGRIDFAIEPTVVASVQPPCGERDDKLTGASIAMAHATDAEMVALHDYTPLFSYRGGVLHVPPEDREVWEEHILPGFTGRVRYGAPLGGRWSNPGRMRG